MVDFLGSYHAILGWPCYAKFMAVPNYTYLKLKMLGPNVSSQLSPRMNMHTTVTSSASSMPRLSRRPRTSSPTSTNSVARRLTPSVVLGV